MTFTWEHVLYRFYAEDGALLYIGITNSIKTRFKRHTADQPWWHEVTDCRVEFLLDRHALERAEVDAIRTERPRYNIRDTMPVRRRVYSDRERERWSPPCVPQSATEPWYGCTCRSRAEHWGPWIDMFEPVREHLGRLIS